MAMVYYMHLPTESHTEQNIKEKTVKFVMAVFIILLFKRDLIRNLHSIGVLGVL